MHPIQISASERDGPASTNNTHTNLDREVRDLAAANVLGDRRRHCVHARHKDAADRARKRVWDELEALERADHPLELGEPRAAKDREDDRARECANEALPRLVGRQAQERRLDELAAKELAAKERKAVVAHDQRHGEDEPEES